MLERDGGETNLRSNRLLENLADLSFRNGDQTKASQLYRRVLEQRRALFGEAHIELMVPLNALGSIHYLQNDYRKAETYYRQALEIAEKILGPEHSDTAACLTNLATTQGMRQQFSRAEPSIVALWRSGKRVCKAAMRELDGGRGSLYTVPLTDLLKQTSGGKRVRPASELLMFLFQNAPCGRSRIDVSERLQLTFSPMFPVNPYWSRMEKALPFRPRCLASPP